MNLTAAQESAVTSSARVALDASDQDALRIKV